MNNIYLAVGNLVGGVGVQEKHICVEQCVRGCETLGVTWEQVKSKNRRANIVDAKRIACMHLRTKQWTFNDIAMEVGLTNHASALHHVYRGEELLKFDRHFQAKYHKFKTA